MKWSWCWPKTKKRQNNSPINNFFIETGSNNEPVLFFTLVAMKQFLAFLLCVGFISTSFSQQFFEGGIYNLTDGADPRISELDSAIAAKAKKSVKVVPLALIQPFAKLGDLFSILPINTYRLEKLIGQLTFDCTKAKTELKWSPNPVLGWFFEQKHD